MIYQCNVFVSIATAAFATFYLLQYVITNKENLFFWKQECEKGFHCHEFYLSGPPSPTTEEFISMIGEMYIRPPPDDPTQGEFDIYTPVWRKLVDWYKVQESLIEIFKDQAPGFYVEVGAVDGDFMTQTLHLERNYGWKGLLIEPDPRAFQDLVKMKRNAWLSPICVKVGYPAAHRYWLRKLEENLPHHFQQLLLARSKLDNEIMEGDEERGSTVLVPCAPLSSMLKAINVTSVDLLTINTGSDDDFSKIKDVVWNKNIETKFLVMHFTTTYLYNQAFPPLKGYIIDAKRSQLLMKIYVRASYCELISTNSCENIETFTVTEACKVYFCFGHLKVLSI